MGGREEREERRKNEFNIEDIVYIKNTVSDTTRAKKAEGGRLEPHR